MRAGARLRCRGSASPGHRGSGRARRRGLVSRRIVAKDIPAGPRGSGAATKTQSRMTLGFPSRHLGGVAVSVVVAVVVGQDLPRVVEQYSHDVIAGLALHLDPEF